jgi:formylglycine-generating enzyme required for sulfatase activity
VAEGPTYTLTDGQTVRPLDTFRDCADCPEMIVLPTGSFMFGAIPGESRNRFDMFGPNPTFRLLPPGTPNIIAQEGPRHRVEMDIPIAMGRNEVTFAEWRACVDAGACAHNPERLVRTPDGLVSVGADTPVVNVSFLDIQDFVGWLNTLVGAPVYRLPTEAEWEYAARAGTETRYAQGDDLTGEQANFFGTGTKQQLGVDRPDLVDRYLPVPVGELDAANGWGLRHMAGNVSEYTFSCWAHEHLGLATDSAYLSHARQQESCIRVTKGGSFGSAVDGLRPAFVGNTDEDTKIDARGFRVVREMSR